MSKFDEIFGKIKAACDVETQLLCHVQEDFKQVERKLKELNLIDTYVYNNNGISLRWDQEEKRLMGCVNSPRDLMPYKVIFECPLTIRIELHKYLFHFLEYILSEIEKNNPSKKNKVIQKKTKKVKSK